MKFKLREVHKKLTTYSGSQKNYSEFDSNKIPSYTRETQSYNNFGEFDKIHETLIIQGVS